MVYGKSTRMEIRVWSTNNNDTKKFNENEDEKKRNIMHSILYIQQRANLKNVILAAANTLHTTTDGIR